MRVSNTLIIEGAEIADWHFGCVRILCSRGSLLDGPDLEAFARWLLEQMHPDDAHRAFALSQGRKP